MAARDFYRGIFESALGPQDLLTEIRVPKLGAWSGWSYLKFNRRAQDWATVGVEPSLMGMGPAPATRLVLEKAELSLEDIDLIEVNEAFAAQALCVARALKFKPEITNISGGAVALGHPIGASGARILTTLLYALKRTGGNRGIASPCIGGGESVAVAVELFA